MLNSGVSASGELVKSCCQLVFQQREKSCCEWCCSRGRGKSETSTGRSCFGSENDGGMGCFCDWEEMKSAEQRCFGVGETVTSVLQRCFGIGEMNSAAQRCSSIGEINSAAKRCFSIVKACSPLENRSFLCFDPANINCRAIFL
jgi:hypothetical protein